MSCVLYTLNLRAIYSEGLRAIPPPFYVHLLALAFGDLRLRASVAFAGP